MKNIDPDFEELDALNPEEKMRMDNQIKRLELEVSGAKFLEHNPDGMELPVEIEAQILDQILAFEKVKKSAKEVSLFEYLKKPKFKLVEELTSNELIKEKKRLMKVFERQGIILTSILPVEESEFYEFMTTDFLKIPMLDMRFDGIVRHFIYEEFRPNPQLEIMQAIYAFADAYFQEVENSEQILEHFCTQEVLDFLFKFKSLYEGFEKYEGEILDFNIKKTVAKVKLLCSWDACIENSRKKHHFQGVAAFDLKKHKKNKWRIVAINLPKLKD
jgi:hypothetical protein